MDVLKFGHGRSYNPILTKNGGSLNAEIGRPGIPSFEAVNSVKINALINVVETLITHCEGIIDQV